MSKPARGARRSATKKPAVKTSKAAAPARWTLMVYLAGDNNLDGAGAVDLREMKKTGSSDQINVLAQFDRAGARYSTKRYRLRQGTTLESDMIANLGETNTGDPAVLRDFLTWGIKNYPADHYMVVLWNHGAGWDDSNLYQGDYFGGTAPPIAHKGVDLVGGALAPSRSRGGSSAKRVPLAQARAAVRRARRALFAPTLDKMVRTRAIAFDDQAQDFLDNIEMKKVMSGIKTALKRKIDILGFDACLMSMLEVGYQIKNCANYSVGSQEEEPNNGWPYDRIVAALTKNPAMKPVELSRDIVSHYLASYGPKEGVTFSATDLKQVGGLATALGKLGRALSKALKDKSAAIAAVRSRVQEYTQPYDQYVDLIDLCDGLEKLVGGAELNAACKDVRTAMAKTVLASGAKGDTVARSNGISVYFPKKQVCKLYATLDFSKRNAWAAFIRDYVESLGRRGWG